MDLSSFLDQAVPHEALPAPIDPQLRRAAYVGLGLVTALMVFVTLGQGVSTSGERPGFFLVGHGVVVDTFRFWWNATAVFVLAGVALGAGVGVGVALYTKGFKWAPPPGHWAAFGVAGLGLVASVPMLVALLVCAVNVLAWVLFIVVVFAIIAVAIYGFFAGSSS